MPTKIFDLPKNTLPDGSRRTEEEGYRTDTRECIRRNDQAKRTMNDAPVLISIRMIGPNPYQMRQAEDPLAVAELAENIERNTLLQPPTVRRTAGPNDYYELAFGHTRLAAFKLLDSQGKAGFEQMPCFVRDLDNLQMFEMAVAENIKRRDLNPIERANAMRTYMDTFQKTSAETGEFFGCDEATVRGAVRLLNLPEPVQGKLASGELTVNAGRQLLTLDRIAPEAVENVMLRVLGGGDPANEVIGALEKTKTAQIMQGRWNQKTNPTAGDGLWRIDLPIKKFPALPNLTVKDAQDGGAVGKEGGKHKKELQGWIDQLAGGLVDPKALIAQGAPAETIEKLAHLVNPPACDECSYHVQSNGVHACGWKACWIRKSLAWSAKEAATLSEKLGIQVYAAERDGEFTELIQSWDKDQQRYFDERIPGLRLAIDKVSNYGSHAFTGSNLVRLVDVTPEHVQAKKDAEAGRAEAALHQEESRATAERERILANNNRELSNRFISEVAIPVFASILDVIKNEEVLKALLSEYVLEDLFDADGNQIQDAKQRLHLLRCAIVQGMLESINAIDWDAKRQGPLVLAENLKQVADSWGLTLPENWMASAQAIAKHGMDNDAPEDDGDE